MTAPLLTISELEARAIMPPSDLSSMDPTFVNALILMETSEVYSRLRKRYAVPFAEPSPEIAKMWVVLLVMPMLYLRRGYDPASDQMAQVQTAADTARAQMKEAADAETGLYDLPLREDIATTGLTAGSSAPASYSEQSAYSYQDVQREALRGGGR